MSWGVNFPQRNGPTPLWIDPPIDNFKIPSPEHIFSSKSYKYYNYDKTKYKVSPYC